MAEQGLREIKSTKFINIYKREGIVGRLDRQRRAWSQYREKEHVQSSLGAL